MLDSYSISKIQDGGYVVFSRHSNNDPFVGVALPVFACTKIGDALEYVREKLTNDSK